MFFLQPSALPPASYSRQVAPVLALACNSCHGDAGGLSTRSYAELMKGGELGKVVVPGDPEASLLVHFLEGRRGEEHRMPLGGRPLAAAQLALIRRWIAEGAKEDPDTAERYALRLPPIRSQPLRIASRVPVPAYLVLAVRDARKRVLHTEVASVKLPRERGDAGAPGDWVAWEVRPGHGWPRRVLIEITLSYYDSKPWGAELEAAAIGRPGPPLARVVLRPPGSL